MRSQSFLVIDTVVLQSANAPIHVPFRKDRTFAKRIDLFEDIRTRRFGLVVSDRLLAEYQQQVRKPRNEAINLFLSLATSGPGGLLRKHYRTPWSGADREKARNCRFPKHDHHVLRTAATPEGSTIITEEDTLLKTDPCIYLRFGVHVYDLEAVARR